MSQPAAVPSAATVALVGLLAALAQSKYVLGHKLAELGPGAPTLEAATAACALAQGELGHARLLFRLAADLQGEPDPWRHDGFQPECPQAMPFLAGAAVSWLELVSALYVADTTVDLLLAPLLGALAPLRKVAMEQANQIAYAAGWLGLLAREDGRIPGTAAAALGGMVAQTEHWLEVMAADTVLQRAGLLPAGDATPAQALRRRVGDLAAATGLNL